jgi:hypothetical protein
VPCPSTSSEKRVCQDIVSQSCLGPRGPPGPPGPRGRRAAADADESERELLADLVLAQDYFYSNNRIKRDALPATKRNVFLVVDSSGSIPYSTYRKALDILGKFSKYFCGDVSFGMVTFSTDIDLEFCSTCMRGLSWSDYLKTIPNKIKSARYHKGGTNTGETIKCLSEELLPSPDCRILTKPTQLVFFTDGRANGCTKVPPALASLVARYPTLETYAIGMGNILKSGIIDLLSESFDPYNLFNVNDIFEFEKLYEYVLALITGGSLECAPISLAP